MLVDRVGGGEPLPEQLLPPGAHALWLNSRLWLSPHAGAPSEPPLTELASRRKPVSTSHSLPSFAKPERVEVYASSPAGGFVPPVRPSSVGRVVFAGTRAASASSH